MLSEMTEDSLSEDEQGLYLEKRFDSHAIFKGLAHIWQGHTVFLGTLGIVDLFDKHVSTFTW